MLPCTRLVQKPYILARGEVAYYRPQTKFAKVMFLQVSVCPRGGGVRGWGHAWQGGGMHGRGWQGGQILRDTVIRSMSGRYASYWNAFLFNLNLTGLMMGYEGIVTDNNQLCFNMLSHVKP